MATLGTRRSDRGWKARDYRVICDCQRHASARVMWRRAARIASRGIAVLVSVPLAFALFDIPTSAMNLDLRKEPVLQKTMQQQPARIQASLPIFTTREVREHFLEPKKAQKPAPTLDVFKEEFFRRHVPYGAIIFREARRNGLPPELVAAMVQTESDFRTTLVSPKSAQGLMQIVPSTARLLGIRDPFNPEENIAAGTKYFRYLLNRFDDESVALAAYNAGEGNVARFGGIPPFNETRQYVEKVTRRASRYRQRVHNTYATTLRAHGATVQ